MIIVGIYGAYDWDANNATDNSQNRIVHKHDNYSYLIEENASRGFVHDSGCTLFVDGKHIASVNEERITREKYDGNFPKNSIDYCLNHAKISNDEVDIVYSVSPHSFIALDQVQQGVADKVIKIHFPKAEIRYVGHHLSHAASSVFTSPFNEGSFLTFDGGGSSVYNPITDSIDYIENNSIGYFNKEKRIFRFFTMPENLYNNFGAFYQMGSAAVYKSKVGKVKNWETQIGVPGKIMGLAAYGSLDNYSKLYNITENPFPFINFPDFVVDGSPEDAACCLQRNFEDGMIDFLKVLKKRHLDNNICFAGGSFLNVCTNSLIREEFDNIHIPPFTDDSGVHFGAAIWGCYEEEEKISVPDNLALLGKEYTNDEIKKYLDMFDLSYREYDVDVVVDRIKDNKIVAWFQGRSEHGPRALGSRSIFMSPTRAENKDIMNERVKHREYWRPFAGIILEECVGDYFLENYTTPYMLYSQHSTSNELPAITHEDKTCRVQTVNRNQNPRVYDLLTKLDPPAILNTSFNDSGEPIVETPYHAVKAFAKMDIDSMVIGDFIIDK